MEWFIYNRTAAYDNIVSAMESQVGDPGATPEARVSMEGISSLRKIFSWTSAAPDGQWRSQREPFRAECLYDSSYPPWTPNIARFFYLQPNTERRQRLDRQTQETAPEPRSEGLVAN